MFQNEPIVVNPSWNASAPVISTGKTEKNGPSQNGSSSGTIGQTGGRTPNDQSTGSRIPETTSSSDSPYKITPRVEKSNSKVKCLKTALIPSITKAELGKVIFKDIFIVGKFSTKIYGSSTTVKCPSESMAISITL